MPRLICVSNRIPLGDGSSGGLVVALADVLAETGGLWVGSSGEEVAEPADTLREIPNGDFRRLAFDLTEAESQGYYAGHSNSVLWPILHARADLMEIEEGDLGTYKAVNRRIARMLMAELKPEDLVWVHDFHLIPLAYELRVLGAKNRIGFFLHTPFPAPFDMDALPDSAETCMWLMHYDLVGLQSHRDVRKFRASMTSVIEAEPLGEDGMRLGDKAVRVGAFPISIDTRDFQALAAEQADKLPPGIAKADRALIIGVDRLDYSKGIPQRFRAFATFLQKHEDWHRHVSLLQISPPTREGVKAYDVIREETETLSGRINGAYSDLGWVPIRYIHRSVQRETLAGLYRTAQVGLVTPLMDGMNLVAKEFVAAQDPKDPGVLILSQFAGAAEQMEEALIVNPHNTEEVSAAMLTALSMPLSERQRRYEVLMEGLLAQDVHWWSRTFLDALKEPRLTAD
jgi:trehalose 6-phosphate synthase